MSDKKTICLNMIVKNEAHIIADTLEHLLKYITFDYWVISDTGSTDATKQIICDFFAAKGVPGELVEHEWKDFGHNRSKAFESASPSVRTPSLDRVARARSPAASGGAEAVTRAVAFCARNVERFHSPTRRRAFSALSTS